MVTKTLTITEEAYELLLGKKQENESFSQEIKRLLSVKKARPLSDFFGIISYEEGATMLKYLEKIKERERNLKRIL